MRCVVAVDLGTSGVRAVAFTEELEVKAEASGVYSFETLAGGGAEQDVGEVINAALSCIASVTTSLGGDGVAALSLCGTASCLAAFGRSEDGYEPLGSAWIWADTRARKEALSLKRQFGRRAYSRTGCPAHASYWPAKLRWAREHRGLFLGRADLMLAGIKDYLYQLLTGVWSTDEATAAATGLYNSQDGRWDEELLEWLGLSAGALPQVEGATTRRPLLSTWRAQLGLGEGVPVVLGSLDGVLAHLGLGCAGPATASCMIGTSGAVRLGATERTLDTKSRTWSYPLADDYWVVGGANNSGGNVLTWLGQLLSGLNETSAAFTPEILLDHAAKSQAGANGLLFLPYVYGERSPLWREDLQGAWVGLSPVHATADMARSVVEGISLNLAGLLEVLSDQVAPPQEIRATGGFTASELWLQLQADVFGRPVSLVSAKQPTSAGAAMVGWQALTGADYKAMSGKVSVVKQITPDNGSHQAYRESYTNFVRVRERLFGLSCTQEE